MWNNLSWEIPVEYERSYENYISTSVVNPLVLKIFRPLCYLFFPRKNITNLDNVNNVIGEFNAYLKQFRVSKTAKRFRCREYGNGNSYILYDSKLFRYYLLNTFALKYLENKERDSSINRNFYAEIELLSKFMDIEGEDIEFDLLLNKEVPFKVFLEVTSKCNLKCSHCSNAILSYDNHVYADMTTLEVKNLIRNLYNSGVFEINITGGEPLIHPDVEEILITAQKYFPGFTVSTNGLCLNNNLLKLLSALRIRYLNISLDGSEKIYSSIRRGGLFKRVKEKIELARDYINDLGITMTLNNQNILDIDNVLNLCNDLNIKKVNFGITKASSFNLNTSSIINKREQEVQSLIKEIISKCENKGLRYFLPTDIPNLSFMAYNMEDSIFNYNFCTAGEFTAKIRCNGDLIPCIYLPENKHINLREMDLFTAFKLLYNQEMLKPNNIQCQQCAKFNKTCRGGCPGRMLFSKKERDPYCNIYWSRS